MKSIALAVVGGRTFRNYPLLCRSIDALRRTHRVATLISGGAEGADQLAERYAAERGLPIQVLKPDWARVRDAGKARNSEIVARADYVIAFWNGRSAGTRDTVAKVKRAGRRKVLQVVHYEERAFYASRAPGGNAT